MFAIVKVREQIPHDNIEYFGFSFPIKKGKTYCYLATDYNGNIWAYHIEPIFDSITGKWDVEDDDPWFLRVPTFIATIEFTGHPMDSLQYYGEMNVT